MRREYFSMISRLSCLIIAISGAIFFFPGTRIFAQTPVELISPLPGTEIIAKRPEIVCRADAFDNFENLMVLFNGSDVTGIIRATPNGFSFTPVEMLNPGTHFLTVIMTGADGNPIQAEFTFSTRHSVPFEEASAKNNLSVGYEKTIEKPDDAIFQNNYKLESNLSHDSTLKEQKWETNFTTNLRYLTQNLAVNAPLEKGINLANYLLTGNYHGEFFQAGTEIGDVYVSETQNTVNLSRRGGTFSADYKGFRLSSFMVQSEQFFGFNGGTGIGGSSDDHIMGVSGEVGLFADKVKFKTIYAAGGEKGDSYSIYSAGGDKKGNVLGFLLSSNFFDNKLNTEAELDFASYDADTTDEFSYEKDNAWKLGANGAWHIYSYGAVYEHFGTDYQVIGNPYVQSDKEGATVNFGAAKDIHSGQIFLSQYHDNVDDDPLYARTNASQGQVQYMFTGFPSLPLGLMYQRSEIKSDDEPEYTPHMETTMDAVSATVNYMQGAWNFGFQAGFSDQNDKTPQNYDTDAMNYSLSSSYYSEYISVSPSVSFNRSRNQPTNTRTDTHTATLDFRGNLWDRRISYECAGTISRSESSDDAIKQDSFNTNFRIAYTLAQKIWGIASPSAGFMGYYNTTEDYVYNTRSHDFTLLFVFSAAVPFAL
jgi:hypothetical protein